MLAQKVKRNQRKADGVGGKQVEQVMLKSMARSRSRYDVFNQEDLLGLEEEISKIIAHANDVEPMQEFSPGHMKSQKKRKERRHITANKENLNPNVTWVTTLDNSNDRNLNGLGLTILKSNQERQEVKASQSVNFGELLALTHVSNSIDNIMKDTNNPDASLLKKDIVHEAL